MKFIQEHAVRLVVAAVAVFYLGMQLLFLVVFTDTPVGAWLGFAIVAFVVVVLSIGAVVAFEQTSEYRGPDWGAAAPVQKTTAAAPAGRRRILVVADASCASSAVCGRVMEREVAQGADVLVVAPVLSSPLHYATSDEDADWREAERRVRDTAEMLRRMGARARGEVGADNPLEAIHDALSLFRADEIIVVTRPETEETWLEHGLVDRARETTGLPVCHVVVEAAPAAT